jgi:hypothetical protein
VPRLDLRHSPFTSTRWTNKKDPRLLRVLRPRSLDRGCCARDLAAP